MKKVNILASLFAGLLMFSACEADRDSNPVYQEPTKFVLNTPAYVNTVYDLEHSTSLELTCSQPDYGFTAATYYAVQVSLTEDFSSFEELSTQYTTAKMNVDASELAVAATNMKVAEGALEEDFPMIAPLYIRLRAYINESMGEIISNTISLTNVKLYFALPPIELPTKLYLIGDFCNWNWDNAPEMIPLHDGTTGTFWRMVYVKGGLKFNTKTSLNGGEVGFVGCTTLDNFNAGISDAGGNIGIANEGWYLIVIRSKVNGRKIDYTVEFNEPAVWLIGNATGAGDNAWKELLEGWKFEVPATADGYFISPAFAAGHAEGARAYVKVDGFDWWKSEIMVFDGKLEYRGVGGDQDRVPVEAGQRLYLNFTNDTGKIE